MPADVAILKVSESLFRLSSRLFPLLEDEPETSTSCPLDEDGSEDAAIDCARHIDVTVQHIHIHNTEPRVVGIPEIWLEPQIQHTPSDLEEVDAHTPTT